MLAVTDTSQTTSGSETSTRTLSWDASGKLLADGESTFTCDPVGCIASAINPNSTATDHTNLPVKAILI